MEVNKLDKMKRCTHCRQVLPHCSFQKMGAGAGMGNIFTPIAGPAIHDPSNLGVAYTRATGLKQIDAKYVNALAQSN